MPDPSDVSGVTPPTPPTRLVLLTDELCGLAYTPEKADEFHRRWKASDTPEIIDGPEMYSVRRGRRIALIDAEAPGV